MKKAAFGANFATVEVENQDEVHYLMPLRAMAYDLAEYAASSVLKRLKKKYCKGGKVNMCKGLQDWAAEERLVGMEQGIEAFVQDKLEDGKSKEEIVSKLILRFQLDDVKANNYYQKYGVR